MRRLFSVVLVSTIVVFSSLISVLCAFAQADQQTAPVAAAVKTDTTLLKRSPVLDAVIEGGEWDPFFQIQQGDFSATAYADWDEANLYVAVQGNRPTDVMITVDACNDGWFHGSDNYIIKALNSADGKMTLTLDQYDSRAKMATPGAMQNLDASAILFKQVVKQDSSIVEIALPVPVIKGLKPAAGANLGLAISLRPAIEGALWTPMATLGDVQVCSMSDRKAAALDQMDISLVLQDCKVVCGQKLMAKVYVKNKSAHTIPVESLVIGGDGRAAKFLNSQRIRLEGLESGKTIKQKFESKIPMDMPMGSWAIGAEAMSGAAGVGRMGAVLASFEVAPPYVLDMDLGEGPMALGVDKQRVVSIKVKNQTPEKAVGEAVITLPDGWRLSPNFLRRRFVAEGDDRITELRFRISPPAGAAPGDVAIKVDVSVGSEKYSLGKNITLLAPNAEK